MAPATTRNARRPLLAAATAIFAAGALALGLSSAAAQTTTPPLDREAPVPEPADPNLSDPNFAEPGAPGFGGVLEGLLGGMLGGPGASEPADGAPQNETAKNFADLASEDEAVRAAAERRIEKAWSRSGSESMDLLLERGQTAAAAENWDEALVHYGDLVMLAPDFASAWTARAVAHYRQGDLGAAITDFGEALALDPMRYDAYAALGRMLEEIDRPDDALRAYSAALKIHPNFAPAQEATERLEPVVLGSEA